MDGPLVEDVGCGLGNFCRFDDGRLVRPFDGQPPTPLTHYVHDAFRALALNERFSCVAGRAAVHRNAYRFGLYDRLGSDSGPAGLAIDLSRFLDDADLHEQPLTAFVASFVHPVPVDEEQFEELLWATLQRLHWSDSRPWASDRRNDPESPEFSFSFSGTGFFVVGLHAGSSRLARRFAWPTLVFNPHRQFDQLRVEGRYQRFQSVIRTREMALQGTLNPMLSDFGEQSEARQYSGRAVGDSWHCPFEATYADTASDRRD